MNPAWFAPFALLCTGYWANVGVGVRLRYWAKVDAGVDSSHMVDAHPAAVQTT
jgi:hypothetical protein